MRPDLVKRTLHELVGHLYDFNYDSFEIDILTKFIDQDATMHMRRSRGLSSFFPIKSLRKKVDNNVQLLIKEAFADSKPTLPILFLVTHSVNVYAELQTFHLPLQQTH